MVLDLRARYSCRSDACRWFGILGPCDRLDRGNAAKAESRSSGKLLALLEKEFRAPGIIPANSTGRSELGSFQASSSAGDSAERFACNPVRRLEAEIWLDALASSATDTILYERDPERSPFCRRKPAP